LFRLIHLTSTSLRSMGTATFKRRGFVFVYRRYDVDVD
jgi:hypothetical protein